MVIIEPCRACAANHRGQLAVLVPCIGIGSSAVALACAQSVSVIGVGPCCIALGGRLHLPAFPGEGVGRTVVVCQRIAAVIIGNRLPL